MSKGDREKAIRQVTDELLLQKFTTELGQKARIERSIIENERMMALREVIADVGRDLSLIGAVPKGMEYYGSLCVHCYGSPTTNMAAFATTSHLGKMTFDLADGALRELTGSTLERFGKARQKLRSGF